MKISINDLPQLIRSKSGIKLGCVVDTNAFFAASLTADRINTWAEEVFKVLQVHSVPTFTNINIRSEYLELQRRVLIPEGLLAFYEKSNKETMDKALKAQLHSLRTQVNTAIDEKRLFKFNDQQVPAPLWQERLNCK
ncbi:hypothetical protein WDW37_18660 [Bdellovibrionota bacterium FG-1]